MTFKKNTPKIKIKKNFVNNMINFSAILKFMNSSKKISERNFINSKSKLLISRIPYPIDLNKKCEDLYKYTYFVQGSGPT